MGVADTTWLMHRQRMSKTATVRVIGRDMDEKMLHIREENCVWTLDEEETAEQQALKAIPDYLWKVADYIDSVGKWQGTATELLVAANISDVKPNQFTRKMAHYARNVFSPRGIEYKYTRTEQKRLFEFFHDDDDGDDDDDDDGEKVDANSSLYFLKYADAGREAELDGTETYLYMIPLIRLSEAYLIAAECAATPEEALEYLFDSL